MEDLAFSVLISICLLLHLFTITYAFSDILKCTSTSSNLNTTYVAVVMKIIFLLLVMQNNEVNLNASSFLSKKLLV